MLLANINFMPHGHCYLWDSVLIALHVGSDAVIAASYFSIPYRVFEAVGTASCKTRRRLAGRRFYDVGARRSTRISIAVL